MVRRRLSAMFVACRIRRMAGILSVFWGMAVVWGGPPARALIVNGVDCDSDLVPTYSKRVAGCPGYTDPPTGSTPATGADPSAGTTPAPGTPPAGNATGANECAGPDLYDKRSLGCGIVFTIDKTTAMVGGAMRTLDAPARIVNGRTMVPLRFLGEAMGAKVAWDAGAKKVTYALGATTVELWIGSHKARVNGRAVALDAAPILAGNRTLVPVRFVSERLGAGVQWDGTTRRVTITPASAESPTSTAPSIPPPSEPPAPPPSADGNPPDTLAAQFSCGSFYVSSGGGGSCMGLPWIKLEGGRYTWGSDRGTYRYSGGLVTFSGSLGGWGPGKVNADGRIVFEFLKNGKSYRVVYYPR